MQYHHHLSKKLRRISPSEPLAFYFSLYTFTLVTESATTLSKMCTTPIFFWRLGGKCVLHSRRGEKIPQTRRYLCQRYFAWRVFKGSVGGFHFSITCLGDFSEKIAGKGSLFTVPADSPQSAPCFPKLYRHNHYAFHTFRRPDLVRTICNALTPCAPPKVSLLSPNF